jgi:hypothetical protein
MTETNANQPAGEYKDENQIYFIEPPIGYHMAVMYGVGIPRDTRPDPWVPKPFPVIPYPTDPLTPEQRKEIQIVLVAKKKNTVELPLTLIVEIAAALKGTDSELYDKLMKELGADEPTPTGPIPRS